MSESTWDWERTWIKTFFLTMWNCQIFNVEILELGNLYLSTESFNT